MQEVWDQIPQRFSEPIDDTNEPGENEAQVQGVYGPRFHLLTVALTKQLAKTLPRPLYTLWGQAFWNSPRSKRDRMKQVSIITFIKYEARELTCIDDEIGTFTLNPYGGNMTSGGGADPVYVFL